MKILVTAFEPFMGQTINPSEKLATQLQKNYDILILPVSFERCWPLLQEKTEQKKYDFVLMLGQAGGRSTICLEKIAQNQIDTDTPDEDGQAIRKQIILPGQDEELVSSLPLEDWVRLAQQNNIQLEVSTSAGLFVCNYLYFQMQFSQRCKCLFVHLPYLPEQGKPNLDFEKMEEAIGFILTQCKALS